MAVQRQYALALCWIFHLYKIAVYTSYPISVLYSIISLLNNLFEENCTLERRVDFRFRGSLSAGRAVSSSSLSLLENKNQFSSCGVSSRKLNQCPAGVANREDSARAPRLFVPKNEFAPRKRERIRLFVPKNGLPAQKRERIQLFVPKNGLASRKRERIRLFVPKNGLPAQKRERIQLFVPKNGLPARKRERSPAIQNMHTFCTILCYITIATVI